MDSESELGGSGPANQPEAPPDPGEVFGRLLPEIRAAATRLMRGQPTGHTLQPTALVNEAYIKLFGNKATSWQDDRHYLTLASLAMRQVLVDHARKAQSAKRIDAASKVPLDQVVLAYESSGFDVLDLNDALDEMASFDPTMAEILTCRFFMGESPKALAERFDVPLRTLQRRWSAAFAWLLKRLR